jgi:hypothetical protein
MIVGRSKLRAFSMLSRSLAIPMLLAASVAVPYVATKAPSWREQWNAPETTALPGTAQWPLKSGGNPFPVAPLPSGPGAALFPVQQPIEGTPTFSLAEVLRMDVTKEWVYQRWPRKSTALSDLGLHGVRVPLVTGAQLYDLAGSLTYYFSVDGRVQRISFQGRTGDPRQLVGLVTQRYGLTPQPTITAGEQLFALRREDGVISRLSTRPAPVLWASSPHDSFSVELDLQDPATARPLAAPLAPLPATASNPSAGGEQSAASAQAADSAESAEPAWKAFFPRRRVPTGQLPNLDHGNIYQ